MKHLIAILLSLFLVSTTLGIQHKPSYVYGSPAFTSQRLPSRVYGVPQHIPFKEYAAPAQKYGPPKINLFGSSSSSSSSSVNSNAFYEQIKTHFGIPKPIYGPPHYQHKPAATYGLPTISVNQFNGHKPAATYGLPGISAPQFGGHKPSTNYGVPAIPASQYGAPKPALTYGTPAIPSAQYGVPKPATSYGPPPKKYKHKPSSQYGPPKFQGHIPQALPLVQPAISFKPEHQPASSYGPPPSGPLHQPNKNSFALPVPNYGPPPLPNINHGPQTTIILTNGHHIQQHQQQPNKQIHIDAAGHTHSISGSQAPFHTSCEGWKPIPGPAGASYIENNNIETQGGYSHVSQDLPIYSAPNPTNTGSGALTNEQLVAVALQADGFTNDNSVHNGHLQQSLPVLGQSTNFQQQSFTNSLNGFNSHAPADSYDPPIYLDKNINGASQNAFVNQDLHDASQGFVPGHLLPNIYEEASYQNTQNGLGLQYGKQSGNANSQHNQLPVAPPNTPVAFRPPVPKGLIENIGATVEHLDKYGVKPAIQIPTYIPPATTEIAQLGNQLDTEYGAPPYNVQNQLQQQQLPQTEALPVFYQYQQHHQGQQQQQQLQQQQQFQQHINQLGNVHTQYGPPSNQLVPPVGQHQYLPPQATSASEQNAAAYSSSASATFENNFGASEQSHAVALQSNALQLNQVEPRHQVQNCGHGPNLSHGTDGNTISQSIPVAEQHSHYYSAPASSYGPPASGASDHLGAASEASSRNAPPNNGLMQTLPGLDGLDGLDVISAHKSESFEITSDLANNNPAHLTNQYHLNENTALTNKGEELLSPDLLQTILSAIEQPQYQQHLPTNHKLSNTNNNNNNNNDSDNNNDNDSNNNDNILDEHLISASSNIPVQAKIDDNTSSSSNTSDSKPNQPSSNETKAIVVDDTETQK